MARMTSDVEGGDAQPSSAAGPPAGVRTAAQSPVMWTRQGKWPATGLPRRKGLPPRGRCRPRRPFLGVFKGFLQAGKGNAGFAPSWFRITSYIWPSCRLPLFCGVGTACSTHFGRGIRSEKQIASCSSLPELQDPKAFPSCKHLKRIDRKCVYTQCHICLVLEMVGTKYCIPVP